ncbi:MAG: hypothetical protein NW226_20095 [Microscillaceae bacterium]|nr:hypothetical protein [Microscillaceae bacterium]
MAKTDSKNKLHAILAVEATNKAQSEKLLEEQSSNFSKNDSRFDGLTRVLIPLEGEGERMTTDNKIINYTVIENVAYVTEIVCKYLNTTLSKEETNSSGTAKAELIIEGQNFGEVSATSLLSLENYLAKVRRFYETIPTLDPTKDWKDDAGKARGYKKTDPEHKYKTEKRTKHIVVHPPTEHFAAEIRESTIDVQVGKYETIYTSTKISTRDKAELLTRIDRVIEAVKVARAKANEAEAVQTDLATKLFNYINKGIILE